MTTRLALAVSLLTLCAIAPETAHAMAAFRPLPGFEATSLPAGVDASSAAVPLGFTVNFFGTSFDSIFVNDNGNVTFGASLSTFTPFDLTSPTGIRIIAPFFADVDTSAPGSGLVTYGTDLVDGRMAFGVNWDNLGYFPMGTDKLDRFQLVLIDRSDTGPGNFDIELNYDRIEWEAGSDSGGSGGLGGLSARAGYSDGSGIPRTFFELPGSGVPGSFLDSNTPSGLKHNNFNTTDFGVTGRYVFPVRNGTGLAQFPLTVVTTGPGRVTGLGIDCGTDCSDNYLENWFVSLTATPDPGFAVHWTGCAFTSGTSCSVTMTAARSVTASFDTTATLTVMKTGSGTGTVVSSPAGIDCGDTCSALFPAGTDVSFTITPDPGFGTLFVSGCDFSEPCHVTMNADRTLFVDFEPLVTLTVNTTGSGTGTVTSSPAGIACPTDCAEDYLPNSFVSLAAAPAPGFAVHWTGCDSVFGTSCSFTMTAVRSVTASFDPTATLTVTKTGSGTGTVTSSPAGIDCGGTCSAEFPAGTVVTFTITPDPGFGVSFLNGCDFFFGGPCRVTMNADRTLTVDFEPSVTLTVNPAGSGTGRVTSSPAGIDCGTVCSADFTQGSFVSLTAAPDSGFAVHWTGCDSTFGTTCAVSMTGAKSVTASFDPTATLTVTKTRITTCGFGGFGCITPTSAGRVVSSPAGIDCGGTCSADFPAGTVITFTITPDPGFGISSLDGCDSFFGPCAVTMNANKTFTVRFGPLVRLTVNTAGAGTGRVTGSGIDCPSDCTEDYPQFSFVSLTAAPDPGFAVHWTGCDSAFGTFCDVSMTEARSVTASFDPMATLTVMKTGSGTGRVVSAPAGIDCGSTCSADFPAGTVVTFVATPDPGSLASFSGCNSFFFFSTSCEVTLNADQTVTAFFGPAETLTVNQAGAGTGRVASSPIGIDCPGDCTEDYAQGVFVFLTATPDEGSTFASWDQCDFPFDNFCYVDMTGERTVTATFSSRATLTVLKIGAGLVSSSPAGIDCGPNCAASYSGGTVVTLTGTPEVGSAVSWTGCDDLFTTGPTCAVTLTTDRTVTARFQPAILTVVKAGAGTGGIVSSLPGIDCGTACSQVSGIYDPGVLVSLTVTPALGSTVESFAGCDSVSGALCAVSMTADRTVTVTFGRLVNAPVVVDNGGVSVPAGNGRIQLGINPEGYLVVQRDPTPIGLRFIPRTDGEGLAHGTAREKWGVANKDVTTEAFSAYVPGSSGAAEPVVQPDTGLISRPEVPSRTESNGTAFRSVVKTRDDRLKVTHEFRPSSSPDLYEIEVTIENTGSDPIGDLRYRRVMDWGIPPDPGVEFVEILIGPTSQTQTQLLFATADGSSSADPLVDAEVPSHGPRLRPSANLQFRTYNSGDSSGPPDDQGSLFEFRFGVPDADPPSPPLRPGQSRKLKLYYGAGASRDQALAAIHAVGADTYSLGIPRNSSNQEATTGPDAVFIFAVGQFVPLTVDVQAQRVGASGKVTAAGIDCGTVCTEIYPKGTLVTLTAEPGPNSAFRAWQGCTSANHASIVGTNCIVNADSELREIVAVFGIDQKTLTVTAVPAEGGTVTSLPTGIECGADCVETYPSTTTVDLTAAAASGWFFDAWTGCDPGLVAVNTCGVSMTTNRAVTATFLRKPTLTVQLAGPGSGTINIEPPGIPCRSAVPGCTVTYNPNDSVTLTAIPDVGSDFLGWSGDGINCPGLEACTIQMTGSRSVTATFTLTERKRLTVAKAGTGSGTVTSLPVGIACGTICSSLFRVGSAVTLTAQPDVGSAFGHWTGGACDGSANTSCSVTMTTDLAVTASFVQPVVTVARAGGGKGTVTSDPPGINCGTSCSARFEADTPVTLTAVPTILGNDVSVFGGWSGVGVNCPGLGTCMVTAADVTVTATFHAVSLRVGNRASRNPAFSADGRFYAFESDATDLAPPCNTPSTLGQIYLVDLAPGGETICVSVGPGGAPGDFESSLPVVSREAGRVAYQSKATNLDPVRCAGGQQIFVWERATGTTTCASIGNGGAGDGDSASPTLSGSGRWLAFSSKARNLDANCNNGQGQIFLRDLDAGTTHCVSLAGNVQGNFESKEPALGGDGNYLVFTSNATNLDSRCRDRRFSQIFVLELFSPFKLTCVSLNETGDAGGTGASSFASISRNGRFVAFQSDARDLDSRCNRPTQVVQIFVHDRLMGKTHCASLDGDGTAGDNRSIKPRLSGDGGRVVYQTTATNLSANLRRPLAGPVAGRGPSLRVGAGSSAVESNLLGEPNGSGGERLIVTEPADLFPGLGAPASGNPAPSDDGSRVGIQVNPNGADDDRDAQIVVVDRGTPPVLGLELNAHSFRTGDEMVLTATLTPGSRPAPVDAYLAVQASDGTIYSLQAVGGPVPRIAPIARGVLLAAAFRGVVARHRFDGSEPPGTYTWFLVLTDPGTLNPFGGVAQASFTFEP